ncbi:TROVE domain-containing protein [Aquisphaera insulae]|uniref:TROVE domain-containing protein n=1 Tax=Aquisphaera insulae TaxID=2712864 RepID=UPI00196AB08D|nr:TROVE domain-containing protein [Aquisphaera insulae]
MPQSRNNAGGFAFAVDDWTRLDRFLVLGVEGGSYYATERRLTAENAEAVRRCLHADGPRTVARIVAISEEGRALKNDPAILALAMAAGAASPATRALALAALPRVCRTGTHLFRFADAIGTFRGWGRALRRAVGDWYTAKAPRELAHQLGKYQSRGGWSHQDLLRLCHVRATGSSNAALRWAVGKGLEPGPEDASSPLAILAGYEAAKRAAAPGEVIRLVRKYGLPRECVPTRWLTDPGVWEALLVTMPLAALVRNLATMTRLGLLTPGSTAAARVVSALDDPEGLARSRLHPIALLAALRTYASGRGARGQGVWTPVPEIVDALDGAFYAAFRNAEPTRRRWLLALDVSGSMAWGAIAGIPGLSARDAAAAMALVTAATEADHHVIGFTGRGFSASSAGGSRYRAGAGHGGVEPLSIGPDRRLDDAIRIVSDLPMGPTDCSLPMLYALERKLAADVFVVYTDSETWHGAIHPVEALRRYRDRTGIAAKLIVVGMVSSGFTIADPDDAGMMDVVGFDAAVPQLIGLFAGPEGGT